MMSSRVYLLLGLLAAFLVLIISSEVAARDLAEEAAASTETQTQAVKPDEVATDETGHVEDAKYGGYPGGGGGGYPGGGGGGYPGRGGGGYPGRGGGGYPGGGGGGYPGGGGGGGGCRYRCCHYGRCGCCSYAGEAPEVETQAQPHN